MADLNKEYWQRALKVLPGGVNSPVRACRNVECDPLFISHAKDAYIFDLNGNKYLDFVLSWGPMLLGHAQEVVLQAINKAASKGTSYGAPCQAEVDLAETMLAALPNVEMLRFTSSGTEATMSALRLARAYTQKDAFIKFAGCYHGHGDAFLVSAGSGVATFNLPASSPGVPEAVVKQTFVIPYNDLAKTKEVLAEHGAKIAAIIVEPVAANMGLVLPNPGFLEGLRQLCDQYKILLIFDEVITGFRLDFAGAQARFKVKADLVTLGKIIGGGLAVGAIGGSKELMENFAPAGNVYQAGTLSGNPLAMAAGLATIQELQKKDYQALENLTAEFAKELQAILRSKGLACQVPTIASMFGLFFCEDAVKDFASAQKSDMQIFIKFYQYLRKSGINLAQSTFETQMLSFCHTKTELDFVLETVKKFTI